MRLAPSTREQTAGVGHRLAVPIVPSSQSMALGSLGFDVGESASCRWTAAVKANLDSVKSACRQRHGLGANSSLWFTPSKQTLRQSFDCR